MIELYEKLDKLKEALDNVETIKKITQLEEEIKKDTKLYKKLQEKDQSALLDDKIIAYKKLENEVNFLILEMNQELKKNFPKDREDHESY